MKFGQFEITPFVEQSFRLDGGSMFGVVPKKIWGKLIEADDNNLIPMVTNLFVLTAYRKNILIDTGLGDCMTEKERKVYATAGESNIETGLTNIGISPDEIDIVFLSHLHTDHAGGAIKEENGQLVPRFKNAAYMVQNDEWQDAVNPNERTAAVYIPERLKVLETAEQLQLLDGEAEILPGIKAVKTGGHTGGHQAIEAESEGTTVVYYADIVPSSHHLKLPYVASVDLFPLTTMDVKRKLLTRLLNGNMAIAFDHDLDIKIGSLSQDNGKLTVSSAEN
jgi:glyoxylase-like metal-dependent hydrolase (beta-lactamase superfamily II)